MSFRNKLQQRQQSQEDAPVHNDQTMALFEEMMGKAVRQRSGADTITVPDGALIPVGDGALQMGGYRLTKVGLVAEESATIETWKQLGGMLFALEGSIQWLIGDWILNGEFQWGQTYEAMAEQTGYEVKTLREYKYVCRSVHLSIRMDKLSFGHHQLVAKLSQDEQVKWLEWAANCNPIPSVAEMRKAMRGKPDKPTLPERVAEALDDLHHSYVFLRDSWRPDMDEDSRARLVEYVEHIEAQAQALREQLIG